MDLNSTQIVATSSLLKIAYIYEYDAANPATQSTRPFSIWRSLRQRFQLRECFPIPNLSRQVLAPKKIAYALLGKVHHLERELLALKEYAWRAQKFLHSAKPDIVFSPSQIIPTYLDTPAKIIFCNDAPFGAVANYYPNFSNLSTEYIRQGYRQEFQAHQNAYRAVYPSAWARDSAIHLHDAPSRTCIEQAFGANLPYPISWEEVKQARHFRRSGSTVNLLLISSDWVRKGGPFALAAVKALRARNIDARLKVIGSAGEQAEHLDPLGRINKWTEQGAEAFKRALFGSDFIMLPSIAEAYGMALWEGAAHGLPMIGRNTGGISSIIRHDETGCLYDQDAGPESVAQWIESALTATRYTYLSNNAFQDQTTRGNWDCFISKVFAL